MNGHDHPPNVIALASCEACQAEWDAAMECSCDTWDTVTCPLHGTDLLHPTPDAESTTQSDERKTP